MSGHGGFSVIAGGMNKPLPSYKGSNKACIEYANNAQRSVNRAVCPFRRDLLTAIAKPGWFDQYPRARAEAAALFPHLCFLPMHIGILI